MVAEPDQYDLPAADELEISLFGPGFGECIVIHYGHGKWITVDSCLEPDRQTPSALKYFHDIGVEPAESVTHNIVTHPDGDHIGGILSLYDACKSSQLVCPIVLSERDMITFVAYYSQNDPTSMVQTTKELRDLLESSIERSGGPVYVKQDTLVVRQTDIQITALAPSDTKVQKFLEKITSMMPDFKSNKRPPGDISRNAVSVALLVEHKGLSMILGADLEETPGQGWTTIISSSVAYASAAAASLFKVAHHGSQNADSPSLWEKMHEPIAILAPFNLGRHRIPTEEDVGRILNYTDKAFSTSSFSTIKTKKLARVDRLLTSHGIKRQDLFPKNGHIRVRISAEGKMNVELFGAATHLSNVH